MRQSTHRAVLEVTKNDKGTHQIVLKGEVVGNRISEKWLDAELCAKHGYCGEELASIKSLLKQSGKAAMVL